MTARNEVPIVRLDQHSRQHILNAINHLETALSLETWTDWADAKAGVADRMVFALESVQTACKMLGVEVEEREQA